MREPGMSGLHLVQRHQRVIEPYPVHGRPEDPDYLGAVRLRLRWKPQRDAREVIHLPHSVVVERLTPERGQEQWKLLGILITWVQPALDRIGSERRHQGRERLHPLRPGATRDASCFHNVNLRRPSPSGRRTHELNEPFPVGRPPLDALSAWDVSHAAAIQCSLIPRSGALSCRRAVGSLLSDRRREPHEVGGVDQLDRNVSDSLEVRSKGSAACGVHVGEAAHSDNDVRPI
jgi:hypothetical protein